MIQSRIYISIYGSAVIVNGEINFTAGGTDEHRFCLRGVGNIRIRVFVGKKKCSDILI